MKEESDIVWCIKRQALYLLEKIMETNFINELLNFGLFWKVEKLSYRHEKEAIDIYVKFCRESFKSSSSYDHEKVHNYRPYPRGCLWHRRWHHLDILQYISYIMAKIPRLKGRDGKPVPPRAVVKSVEIPRADSHEYHTCLFERGAINLSRRFKGLPGRIPLELKGTPKGAPWTKNQTKTAELLRCPKGVLRIGIGLELLESTKLKLAF